MPDPKQVRQYRALKKAQQAVSSAVQELDEFSAYPHKNNISNEMSAKLDKMVNKLYAANSQLKAVVNNYQYPEGT